MQTNRLKTRLNEGRPVAGVIAPNCDPILAETIGYLGYDFYMIDAEHGPATVHDVQSMVRACEVSGTIPLARVESLDEKLILRLLDTGVMGIMVPGVNTVADLKNLVRAVRYPPVGGRGLGPIRAAEYFMGKMTQEEYVHLANEQLLLLPQIETKTAMANLDQMLDVSGIDGFVIGPRDLAMDMGFIDGPNHPEVQAAVDTIIAKVRSAGMVAGTVAPNADVAKGLIEKGVTFCLNSVSGLLKSASTDFLKAVQTHR